MIAGRWALRLALALMAVMTVAGALRAVGSHGAMPYRYADPLAGARQQLENAQPGAAVGQLQLYVRLEPGDARAWHLLGVAVVLADDMPGWAAAVETAQRMGPGAERALARGVSDGAHARRAQARERQR